MAKLGTTEEAAKLRAKMQSSSLMSDMQAFKVRGLTAHYNMRTTVGGRRVRGMRAMLALCNSHLSLW